ncbi:glycosyltransferase family 2 protein [Rummeliibacillus suwonensis]|uniref:glycosyltransferase family 2 protein n=1 Tax=Rummeliibacillus suwonensis TaxID=1306154 RepID=UPI001AAE1B98|nr:glycosyltransferase [Rummeliibacillus suwonensis]MBO2535289.1 glycosyltransferase [Rummeliibacillus suwonensis]
MENILVSIDCITYNHEQYIADALDSFLMQQTNFKYEILIHDDASTDRTAEIIRAYEKRYPEIIKPIYQLENQYSKGVAVENFNSKRAKGKYLAICEGDDYWIDPCKLQKQVDYMEKHPKCSLCVHAGNIVTASEKKLLAQYRSYKESTIVSVSDVIAGGGGLFLTNSMLCLTAMVQKKPKFVEASPVGDYPLAIHLALLGTVYYMDDIMSAYRVGDANSWTALNFSNMEDRKEHFHHIAKMLDELNIYTNYQYEHVIENTKLRNHFFLLVEQRKFSDIKSGQLYNIYSTLDFKRKCMITMSQYCPALLNFLKSTRKKLVRWATK